MLIGHPNQQVSPGPQSENLKLSRFCCAIYVHALTKALRIAPRQRLYSVTIQYGWKVDGRPGIRISTSADANGAFKNLREILAHWTRERPDRAR